VRTGRVASPVEVALRRPRWALAAACAVVSWMLAGAFAVIALISGSQFASGPAPDPSSSVVFWVLAGVLVALPIAALPRLGFRVRRSVPRAVAAALVVAVTVIGVCVLNTP